MKKSLLVLGTMLSAFTYAQDCTDLFISEYVEGWSNNKAIEIYNPTSQTIDLSLYFISRYSNGATSATAANSIQLTGSIAPYSTHVGVIQKLDPNGTGQEAPVWDSLQARADAFYCPDYNVSNAFYWNGNDAIVLAKGTTSNISAAQLVDVFGKIGQDPENATLGTNGWSTVSPFNMTSGNPNDVSVTENHSLIRKATVLKGKNNPGEVFGPTYQFNPLLEYDSIPAVVPKTDAQGNIIYQTDGVTPQWLGNWFSLGTHQCNCAPLSVNETAMEEVKIYPNPTSGVIYVSNVEQFSKVEVYNTLGQRVFTQNVSNKPSMKVDLGANQGLYLVKFTNNNGETITRRVIVK